MLALSKAIVYTKNVGRATPAQVTLSNMYVRVKWRDMPEELFVRAENCRLTLKKTAYFSEQRLTKNKSEKGQGLCAQLCEGTSGLRWYARGFKASTIFLLLMLFITIHVAQILEQR